MVITALIIAILFAVGCGTVAWYGAKFLIDPKYPRIRIALAVLVGVSFFTLPFSVHR